MSGAPDVLDEVAERRGDDGQDLVLVVHAVCEEREEFLIYSFLRDVRRPREIKKGKADGA